MKIRYALMSCNGEMDYLGYWPVTALAWRKLGITPVLFFIPDKGVTEPPPADGIVHRLEPLADVEMSMQYLWARYWGTQFYPDDVVIISDIDMLPLSREYFVDQLENISDNSYVFLDSRNPPLLKDIKKFPTAFHVARGNLFKEVLALPGDWGQAAREVAPYYTAAPGVKCSYAGAWNGDEIYATMKIRAYEKQSVFKIPRGMKPPPFPDYKGKLGKIILSWRLEKNYLCIWDPALHKQGYYLDAHLPIPCTPLSLELANLLLEGDPPPGKVQKSVALEEDFLKRGGGLFSRLRFVFRLFLLACCGRNRSALDAAFSRLITTAIVRRQKAILRWFLEQPG